MTPLSLSSHTAARPLASTPQALFMCAALSLCATSSLAQSSYNFSEVTRVAIGMLRGTNIEQPVPGFELLLMRDGEVVYRRAFGNATLGQVFACDSATKTLAGGLMTSVMDSSATPLSLDSTVGQFFPNLPPEKAAVTMRQAFSHSAGYTDVNTAMSSPTLTLQQAAALILSRPMDHAAGQAFSYGGSEMHVAGAVAELATGESWNSLFTSRIAAPLGLTQTRFVLSSETNPRIAGGAESTAPEFGRFMEMLRRGGVIDNTRVLSREGVQAMLTRQSPLGVPILYTPHPEGDDDYGVGIWLDERTETGELIGALAAGARGFQAWIDLDDRMVGVFATDLSSSSNVIPGVYLLREAAQIAIRNGPDCDAIDFNLDGFFPDDQDLVDFLSVFAGGPCSTGPSQECNDIDFNNDGLFPDDADLVAFLRVLAGGSC
jgi:CubicO group peptidase (beta-lactamase class C family)